MRFAAMDIPGLKLEAERAFDGLNAPGEPTALFARPTAGMPPAADYPNRQLWNTTIKRICVSDGVHWLRTDTGAIV